MVKAPIPDSRMFSFSAGSTSRRPTTAARAPSTIGPSSPARETRLFSPMPRATARGMPWMFPLGEVSGVFMSPWASNQMRPMRSSCFRKWRDTPAMVPIAIEWSPPSTTGIAHSPRARSTSSRTSSQVWRISLRYFMRGSPGSCVSWMKTLMSP